MVVVLDSSAETGNPASNVIYDHDFANGNNDGRDPKFSIMKRITLMF